MHKNYEAVANIPAFVNSPSLMGLNFPFSSAWYLICPPYTSMGYINTLITIHPNVKRYV